MPETTPPASPQSNLPALDANRVRAQPPVGATRTAAADLVYAGIAKHTASLGAYMKWVTVSGVGAVLAYFLAQVATIGSWAWFCVALGVPGLIWTYLRHITTRFTVSTRRIEFERGIVSKDVDSLELWRVLDVRYHQTLLDRVFNNGKIVLVSTDRSHPEFVLHGLPNHRALFERLRDSVHVARQSGRPLEIAGDDEIV